MANSNPSHATRFKKGEIRNPGGKTTEQKGKEMANAKRAVKIRERLLMAIECELDKTGDSLELLNSNVLKMLKDTEDRGLGSPVQAVFTENLTPEPTIDVKKLSMGALKELQAAGLKHEKERN